MDTTPSANEFINDNQPVHVEPSKTVLMIGDDPVASEETLAEINKTRYRQVNYSDLDPNATIYGPCVIHGSPKGSIFMSHDNQCVTLSLREKMMLRIGALSLEALDAKYNNEPRRGW